MTPPLPVCSSVHACLALFFKKFLSSQIVGTEKNHRLICKIHEVFNSKDFRVEHPSRIRGILRSKGLHSDTKFETNFAREKSKKEPNNIHHVTNGEPKKTHNNPRELKSLRPTRRKAMCISSFSVYPNITHPFRY